MANSNVSVRNANYVDASAMLAIYRPYVEGSFVSFEQSVPSIEEFDARLRKYLTGWACLVAEANGKVVGYAYGSSHRERAAYKWSVETSVYVAQHAQRGGVGRKLYEALMPKLADSGFCNAYAGVALPNVASLRLHESFGFKPIGTFPRVGYKFGQWRDVAWFHLMLRDEPVRQGGEPVGEQ